MVVVEGSMVGNIFIGICCGIGGTAGNKAGYFGIDSHAMVFIVALFDSTLLSSSYYFQFLNPFQKATNNPPESSRILHNLQHREYTKLDLWSSRKRKSKPY